MRSRNWAWLFSKNFRGYCLMYCFGGNHRYSLFEDFWETLGATFGAILGATLDANFGRKKIFKIFFFLGIPTLDKLMIFIEWDYFVCLYILEKSHSGQQWWQSLYFSFIWRTSPLKSSVLFVSMNEKCNDCHHQKTTRTILYTRSKNKFESF